MILKASQRGGGSRLAAHLMNIADNDHITVHEVRGFVAQSLHGAFNEADAISRATKCKQFLFSLSLNPPKDGEASVDDFLGAIDRAETALGLSSQPRAIVFHEKEGRRHAHVVWSRIDGQELKAINLPHFKNKLARLSKELYLEHGWELPEGHKTNDWKNPLNFTLAEFQQAKRLDMDPREIKQVFRAAFAQSDSPKAFKAALEHSGYYLAKGDRRGFVAVDFHGEVYSVARWTGIKTKELRSKFGEPENLPSVDEVRANTRKHFSQNLRSYMDEMRAHQRAELRPLQEARKSLVRDQRIERIQLKRAHTHRTLTENNARQERFNKGLRGVYDLLTGKARAIKRENQAETQACMVRDRGERELLFESQMKRRADLQIKFEALRENQKGERLRLMRRVAEVLKHTKQASQEPERPSRGRGRGRSVDHGPSL